MSFMDSSGTVFSVSAESPTRITEVAFASNLSRVSAFPKRGKEAVAIPCLVMLVLPSNESHYTSCSELVGGAPMNRGDFAKRRRADACVGQAGASPGPTGRRQSTKPTSRGRRRRYSSSSASLMPCSMAFRVSSESRPRGG